MQISRVLARKVLLPFLTHPPRPFHCEMCDGTRIMVRTDPAEGIGSRCLSCRGTVFHRSMFKVIRQIFGADLARLRNGSVYEISAHGALYGKLKLLAGSVPFSFIGSEFLDGWQPGQVYDGIRCENLEALTFPDQSFDLVTSTGLMEHVENDAAADAEVRRVLKSGGYTVFTVPYFPDLPKTLVRAQRQNDGTVTHFEEPEYHSDPFRGDGGVFTWRHYGPDIINTLKSVGLRAEVRGVPVAGYTGEFPVIIAQR